MSLIAYAYLAAMIAIGAALTALVVHFFPWSRARIGAALAVLALFIALGCYFFDPYIVLTGALMAAGGGPIAYAVWYELRPWSLPKAGAAALFTLALLAFGA